MAITIRPATRADAEQILTFITDLAIFEKAEEHVIATVADIERSLFSEQATTHALMCYQGDQPVGFAVYFFSYSTWQGRRGLYLEDLYVATEHRRCGAGKALLRRLAQLACEHDCGRFEWSVLDWNQPAIDFYESIGAQAQDEWVRYRLDGERLKQFAQS
ncbi:GNAT family N-acetyltransferase [Pseudomonas sp. R5(2019)]|uniref:GNAT family N-acetyltransferase n=1 Tax=Pseudomonas sp. R5(2019) TaxID=2697566 RepID=UPI001412768A|nr:GNAT family N-acetyltransferase [Pseudomonas sp. R5(2019)]